MPVMFDSSIYIMALRLGDVELLQGRWLGESQVWLSSVVVEELYAGAKPNDRRVLAKLEQDLGGANRTLTPNAGDWKRAGEILAQMGLRYGYEQIGKVRLTNDALIATSASRTGTTVITANQRDFARLGAFCPLQWQAKSVQGS
jgi:predicted nucleic acid-binding protein